RRVRAQAKGQLSKEGVTGIMAVRVVQGLHPVDVDAYERERSGVFAQHGVELREEVPEGGEPRESVLDPGRVFRFHDGAARHLALSTYHVAQPAPVRSDSVTAAPFDLAHAPRGR